MRMNAKHLASFIRTKRKELNLSQSELTNKLGWNGVNAQYISNVELGKCPFPPKSVNQLATVLNVSTDEIRDIMVQDYAFNLSNELSKVSNVSA